MHDGDRFVAVEVPAQGRRSRRRHAVVPSTAPPRTPDPMSAPALRWGRPRLGVDRLEQFLQLAAAPPPAARRDGSRDAGRHSPRRSDRSGLAGGCCSAHVDVVYIATPTEHLRAHGSRRGRQAGAGRSRWASTRPPDRGTRRPGAVHGGAGHNCNSTSASCWSPRRWARVTLLADMDEHFGRSPHHARRSGGGPLLDLSTYPDPSHVGARRAGADPGSGRPPSPPASTASWRDPRGRHDGNQAVLHHLLANTPTATIAGTQGFTLTLSEAFFNPRASSCAADGERRLRLHGAARRPDALCFEAADVIAAGRRESAPCAHSRTRSRRCAG